MAFSNKYELETIATGTTGTSGIFDSDMEIVEDYLHTLLRYKVASGEALAAYDPLTIINSEWKKASDPAGNSGEVRWPSAIAIEIGTSGEWVRGQRSGPITNAGWSWCGSGEAFLGVSSNITQVSNTYKIGNVISETTIVVQL